MNDGKLTEQLGAWVAQGFITLKQAGIIAVFEAGLDRVRGPEEIAQSPPTTQSPAGAAVETSPTDASVTKEPPAQKIPLAVEILGYIGGVLVLAALIALMAPARHSVGPGLMALVSGVVTVALLVAGWVLAAKEVAQLRRLGHFLMFMGVVVSGFFFAMITDVVTYRPDYDKYSLLVTGGVFVLSLVTWISHKTSLQLIAVTLSLAGLIGSFCWMWFDSSRWMVAGLAYVVLGALYILAAESGRLAPKVTAWDLGAVAIVAGLQICGH